MATYRKILAHCETRRASTVDRSQDQHPRSNDVVHPAAGNPCSLLQDVRRPVDDRLVRSCAERCRVGRYAEPSCTARRNRFTVNRSERLLPTVGCLFPMQGSAFQVVRFPRFDRRKRGRGSDCCRHLDRRHASHGSKRVRSSVLSSGITTSRRRQHCRGIIHARREASTYRRDIYICGADCHSRGLNLVALRRRRGHPLQPRSLLLTAMSQRR